MAFNAGAIFGTAKLNTGPWKGGLGTLVSATKVAAAAISAAFVVTMVKSIKKANEFQKAVSNVSTLVDTSAVSMFKMSKAVLNMNPALGDATELTNGLYQAFSAGASDLKEAMQITTDAAKFARAALTDTNTAVDVLTTAVNAYGKEMMDTTTASDLFFTTIKQGKITGEQLAGTIGQSIPLFASAGIELEQLSAGIAAMTKQGVNAANATTQLNGIVNSFLKPQEALNDLITEYGYESGAALLKAEGLTGALKLVEDATDGDAAAMAELLPNIRALRGAMALTGVGGEELNRILIEMESSSNATAEAFDKQEKTFATFGNAAGQVFTIIGNIGKALLDEVVVGLTESAIQMRDFLQTEEAMFGFAQVVGFVAGSFSAIKTAVTILWETLKNTLQPVIDVMRETFAEIFESFNSEGVNSSVILAGAMKSLGIAIAIPVNVISTLVNLIVTLVKSTKLGAQSVGNFFKVMKGEMSFKEFRAQAQAVNAEVGDLWKDFGQDTKDIWTPMIDQLKSFTDDVKAGAEDIRSNVSISYDNATNWVLKNYKEWVAGAKKTAADIKDEQEEITDSHKEGAEERIDNTESEVQKQIEARRREAQRQREIDREIREAKEVEMQLWEDALREYYARQEELEKEQLEKWRLNWQARVEIVNQHLTLITDTIGYGFSTFGAIASQFYTNEKARMENEYNDQLDILDSQLASQAITQEQYNERKEVLDEKYRKKQNELAKKQFETQKALDIANVWMNAASSIMGWWATAWQLGPIAGPIFAGIMTGVVTGAAIAQHALIAKQQFVPKKAEGGRTPGGNLIMNEEGPEMVRLPGGSLIIPNQLTEQIAGASGGGFSGTINIYEPRVRSDEDIDLLVSQIVTRLGSEMRIA